MAVEPDTRKRQPDPRKNTFAKIAVILASLLAIVSIGGGFFAGFLLIPIQWVLSRDSGPIGRAAWGLLAASLTWEILAVGLYVLIDDETFVGWFLPTVAALAIWAAFVIVGPATRSVDRRTDPAKS